MKAVIFFRLLIAAVLGLVGWRVGEAAAGWPWFLPLAVGGAVVGALVAPYITTQPLSWGVKKISQVPTPTLLAGVIGLLIALLASALLTLPLSLFPGSWGRVLPLVMALVLTYLIVSLMTSRARDFFRFLGLTHEASKEGVPMLVDTSALIDGRIADVSGTGFVMGQLLIPSFVLAELQHIADSPDPQRRRRGRRGLEMLHHIREDSEVPLQIVEVDIEGDGVDDKLVRLSKSWNCPIVTTDFNLNRVAELQGVKVLNLNDLATAVRPVVLPGEEMEIRIIQEGKELGQGVGFLDDGTMVVVEGGKRFLNSKVEIVITRVLQTPMGRMIFAQMKNHERGEKGQ